MWFKAQEVAKAAANKVNEMIDVEEIKRVIRNELRKSSDPNAIQNWEIAVEELCDMGYDRNHHTTYIRALELVNHDIYEKMVLPYFQKVMIEATKSTLLEYLKP
jgi:hypothetical protein